MPYTSTYLYVKEGTFAPLHVRRYRLSDLRLVDIPFTIPLGWAAGTTGIDSFQDHLYFMQKATHAKNIGGLIYYGTYVYKVDQNTWTLVDTIEVWNNVTPEVLDTAEEIQLDDSFMYITFLINGDQTRRICQIRHTGGQAVQSFRTVNIGNGSSSCRINRYYVIAAARGSTFRSKIYQRPKTNLSDASLDYQFADQHDISCLITLTDTNLIHLGTNGIYTAYTFVDVELAGHTTPKTQVYFNTIHEYGARDLTHLYANTTREWQKRPLANINILTARNQDSVTGEIPPLGVYNLAVENWYSQVYPPLGGISYVSGGGGRGGGAGGKARRRLIKNQSYGEV